MPYERLQRGRVSQRGCNHGDGLHIAVVARIGERGCVLGVLRVELTGEASDLGGVSPLAHQELHFGDVRAIS
jgi:hypothetical protein